MKRKLQILLYIAIWNNVYLLPFHQLEMQLQLEMLNLLGFLRHEYAALNFCGNESFENLTTVSNHNQK